MENTRKVRFLKDHINDIKKGDVGEFKEARAYYLVRVGLAEYVEENEPKQSVKQSKEKPKKAVKAEPCKTC